MKRIYGVFIIESLRGTDFYDGETLSDILSLSMIENVYRWIECEEDLNKAIEEFGRSGFRYLHFSFHGDYTGIQLTNNYLTNSEFVDIIKNHLMDIRVFISACKGGNRELSGKIIKHGATSAIGIPLNVSFDKTTLFWPSFYHVINEHNIDAMKRVDIIGFLEACSGLFKVPINYYSFIKKHRTSKFRRVKIRKGQLTENKILNM